jgi:hypothetical protein
MVGNAAVRTVSRKAAQLNRIEWLRDMNLRTERGFLCAFAPLRENIFPRRGSTPTEKEISRKGAKTQRRTAKKNRKEKRISA